MEQVFEVLRASFELSAKAMELLGVSVLLIGVIAALFKHLHMWLTTHSEEKVSHFNQFRKDLGRNILLSFEFFVAADVIALVAVEQTLFNLIELSLLIVIRTFLSTTLELELTGSWPWQKKSLEEE